MSTFISPINHAESATLSTTDTITNLDNLKVGFTDQTAVVDDTTSVQFTGAWGGTSKVISSFALHEVDVSTIPGATVRYRVYDNVVPASGNTLADSGVIPLVKSYLSSTTPWSKFDYYQNVHTFAARSTVSGSSAYRPAPVTGLSFTVDIAFTGAAVFTIGSLFVADAWYLPASLLAQVEDTTAAMGRPSRSFNGGVSPGASSSDRTITLTWDAADDDARNMVSAAFDIAKTTRPVFIHHVRGPDEDPIDRYAEGGVLRFYDAQVSATSTGRRIPGRTNYHTIRSVRLQRYL